ncbi:hypothetical protein HDU81_006617 [Chytriomyces hyalinus]|nr:hypothetical protein HDU81_006617 [Chytriomyces hyalinus]
MVTANSKPDPAATPPAPPPSASTGAQASPGEAPSGEADAATSEIHASFVGSTLLMRTHTTPAETHHHHHDNWLQLKAARIDSVIGSGSFSFVYLAHSIPIPQSVQSISPQEHSFNTTTSTKIAVKRLFKEGLDAKQLVLQRHEVNIMKDIGPHKNIVPLIGTVEDTQCLYLAMEYCEMDLYDAITKKGGFSESAVKNIFAQIVDAVIHCHSKGYFHRDLKPENCLIMSKSVSAADFVIKLTDFGLATSDTWSTEMGCGSVRYMPPECFDPKYVSTNPNIKPQHKEKLRSGAMINPFSSKTGYPPASSDVWSLGVILINLLFAKNPWFEAHPTDPIFSAFAGANPNILRTQFNLSPHFDALLRRCFDLDPRRRCSVHDLKVLVANMPQFVGESVPGLIVPYGPPPLSKSGKNSQTVVSSLDSKLEAYMQDPVLGLVFPPNVDIPAQLTSQQLRLVLGGSQASSPAVDTVPSQNRPLSQTFHSSSSQGSDKISASPQAHYYEYYQSPAPQPFLPSAANSTYQHQQHQQQQKELQKEHFRQFYSQTQQRDIDTSTGASTTGAISSNYNSEKTGVPPPAGVQFRSSLPSNPPSTPLRRPPSASEVAAEATVAISAHQLQQQAQQQQQQHFQTPIRFPSLRRRLSRSFSGIQNAVRRVGSGFFGPSSRVGKGDEQQHDDETGATNTDEQYTSPAGSRALLGEGGSAQHATASPASSRAPSFTGLRFWGPAGNPSGAGAPSTHQSGVASVTGGNAAGFFKRKTNAAESGSPGDYFFRNGSTTSPQGNGEDGDNRKVKETGSLSVSRKGSVDANLRKMASSGDLVPGPSSQRIQVHRRASYNGLQQARQSGGAGVQSNSPLSASADSINTNTYSAGSTAASSPQRPQIPFHVSATVVSKESKQKPLTSLQQLQQQQTRQQQQSQEFQSSLSSGPGSADISTGAGLTGPPPRPQAPTSLQAWHKEVYKTPSQTPDRGVRAPVTLVPSSVAASLSSGSSGGAWTPPSNTSPQPAWGDKYGKAAQVSGGDGRAELK